MVPYNNSDAIFVSASCSLVLFWAVVRARVSLFCQFSDISVQKLTIHFCGDVKR